MKIKTFLLSTCCLLLIAWPANAQTMSNEDYIIRTQGLNTISGAAAGEGYKLRTTTGDLNLDSSVSQEPGTSEGVNFKIKTGFENLISVFPFSISLSSDLVDFGALSPTNPIIRTLDINTNSGSAYGYSVLISENEALAAIPPASKTIIPDTTCDKGDCNSQNASEWINTLTYGLGYRCDNMLGTDCNSSFTQSNLYKHFPNITENDNLQPIMAGIGSNNKEIRVSYKVNIPVTQAQGIYNNVVTYIAVPNF